MADTVQIGTFDSTGRFSSVLDLNDGVNFSLVRDTLHISPLSGEQAILAKSGRRYGGAKPVGATHDNGVFEAEWLVNSSTRSDDATWANFDALVAILQDAVGGPYYIKFKSQGASRAAYHELKLPVAYDPLYRWIEMQGAHSLHIKVSFPIAPLAVGDPLDVLDGFATNTLSDYTALQGSGTLSWSSAGVVVPTSTTAKFFQHTARGYQSPDSQNTIKFRTGASGAGTVRLAETILDSNNYLYAEVDGTNLGLKKMDGGTPSTLVASTALTLLANTTYWLRVRKEGNNVFAEVFTSAPTPMASPLVSRNATLAGADATKFGAGVKGGDGFYFQPPATDWQINAFNVEPYTYRNQTLPNTILLRGIPGTAPARVDVYTTASGGSAAPQWAMFGWATNPSTGASPAPLGLIEAETGGDLSTGFATAADAAARGGSKLQVATSTGGNPASATWLVDPSLVRPDAFVHDEIQVEVWARVAMDSTVLQPTLTLSAFPEGGTNFGPTRYSAEYGSLGKLLTKPSTGGVWRFVRAGTITLPVRSGAPRWKLKLALGWSAGSTGNLALDYLVLVPARQRALSPSAKPNDATFPDFIRGTTETTKLIRWDLAGWTAQPPAGYARDTGLGGQLIEMSPGDVLAVVKLSSLVPDDPTSDTTTEQLAHSATVHFAVQPTYHLTRSS